MNNTTTPQTLYLTRSHVGSRIRSHPIRAKTFYIALSSLLYALVPECAWCPARAHYTPLKVTAVPTAQRPNGVLFQASAQLAVIFMMPDLINFWFSPRFSFTLFMLVVFESLCFSFLFSAASSVLLSMC